MLAYLSNTTDLITISRGTLESRINRKAGNPGATFRPWINMLMGADNGGYAEERVRFSQLMDGWWSVAGAEVPKELNVSSELSPSSTPFTVASSMLLLQTQVGSTTTYSYTITSRYPSTLARTHFKLPNNNSKLNNNSKNVNQHNCKSKRVSSVWWK